jgi:hypothetical protein
MQCPGAKKAGTEVPARWTIKREASLLWFFPEEEKKTASEYRS